VTGYKFGLVTLAAIALAVGGIYGLHRSAFCFSTFHFMSDEEILQIAVQSIVRNSEGRMHDAQNRLVQQIPYKNVDELIQINQNCCNIISFHEDNYHTFLEFTLGYVGKTVSMNYKTRYIDQENVKHEFDSSDLIPISPCGEILLEN
jgi:hypothetical protein